MKSFAMLLSLKSEDITPLRSKLLNLVKNDCDGDFVLYHTYNGKIQIKNISQKTWDFA